MADEFSEMLVQRRKGGAWEVLMTPFGYGAPICITGFPSERAARKWIDREAIAWLAAHKAAA